jgi:AcrR family transcriptional regulator
METKDKILISAKELFFEKGYEQTKTKEVALKAGVSEALVFKHFKKKDNLLLSVLKNTMEQFKVDSEDLVNFLLHGDMAVEEKLKFFIKNRMAFIEEHYMPITIIVRQMQFDPKVMVEVNIILSEKVKPVIHKLVTDFYQVENLNTQHQEVCEKMILGLFFDLLLQKSIFKNSMDEKDLFEKLNFILKGARHA